MSKNQNLSVLVDTSFLITLYDKERANHSIALKYFEYFLSNSIKIYLSTIVISEFHQGQSITDIISSGNYIVLPYNFEDAVETARMAYDLGNVSRKRASRPELKDDLKLMGQAVFNDIDFIITEDESTLARFCKRLSDSKMYKLKTIIVKDGFDASYFQGGQSSLLDKD